MVNIFICGLHSSSLLAGTVLRPFEAAATSCRANIKAITTGMTRDSRFLVSRIFRMGKEKSSNLCLPSEVG